MILPNGKFKGYINLCLGLVLILLVLKPLSDFLKTGVNAGSLFRGAWQSADLGDPETYSGVRDEMIQQSLNQQAQARMSGICEQAGFKLISADVTANGDFTSLQEINLTVSKIGAGSRPFIYVEPPASDEPPEIKSLKNTLSEVYNMSLDNIHISETEQTG